MGLQDCVEEALAAETITSDQAGEIRELIKGSAGTEEELINGLLAKKEFAKYSRAMQAIRWERARQIVTSHPKSKQAGAEAVIGWDKFEKTPHPSAEDTQNAVISWWHMGFSDHIQAMESKWLGFDKRGRRSASESMLFEAYGRSSGHPPAKQMWADYSRLAKGLAVRLNIAGVHVQIRENYVPQTHNQTLIKNSGKEAWTRYMKARENEVSRYSYDLGRDLDGAEFDARVDAWYENLSNGGTDEVKPGRAGTAGLANRHTAHREIEFKTPEAWLKYNETYGNNDVWATLYDHVRRMAREIAMAETLGPNPVAGFRYLSALAEQGGRTSRGLENMWASFTGEVDQFNITGPRATAYQAVETTKKYVSSVLMQAATVSTITDFPSSAVTLRMNGMGWGRFMGKYWGSVLPGATQESRRTAAIRLGVGIVGNIQSLHRWLHVNNSGEGLSAMALNGVARKIGQGVDILAESSFRLNLLQPHTQLMKASFGLEFSQNFAEFLPSGFAEQNLRFARQLERYGFTEKDWTLMQRARSYEYEGTHMFDPLAVMDVPGYDVLYKQEVMNRYLGMLNNEMIFAIPEPDLRVDSWMKGTARRDTGIGQIVRVLGTFRSFPATLLARHAQRYWHRGAEKGMGSLIAAQILTAWMFGAVAVQIKDVLRGKDPRPMTTPGFWLAALVQSGGLSIFGDVLFADHNRIGGSVTQTLAGPIPKMLEDLAKLSGGNIQQWLGGDATNFASEALWVSQKYAPFMNTWYFRVIVERLIWDAVKEFADPNSGTRFRRMADKTPYWWEPGSRDPRVPDLGRALGE